MRHAMSVGESRALGAVRSPCGTTSRETPDRRRRLRGRPSSTEMATHPVTEGRMPAPVAEDANLCLEASLMVAALGPATFR